jgi:hypothetical protein
MASSGLVIRVGVIEVRMTGFRPVVPVPGYQMQAPEHLVFEEHRVHRDGGAHHVRSPRAVRAYEYRTVGVQAEEGLSRVQVDFPSGDGGL